LLPDGDEGFLHGVGRVCVAREDGPRDPKTPIKTRSDECFERCRIAGLGALDERDVDRPAAVCHRDRAQRVRRASDLVARQCGVAYPDAASDRLVGIRAAVAEWLGVEPDGRDVETAAGRSTCRQPIHCGACCSEFQPKSVRRRLYEYRAAVEREVRMATDKGSMPRAARDRTTESRRGA